MESIKSIFTRKSPVFLTLTVLYLLIVSFLAWGIHPSVATLLFVIGGIIGMYFLDVAEVVFTVSPSPFRTIVFTALFALVSFFIVTSSGNYLAIGLVLSIFLTIILWQGGEFAIARHVNSWYRMVADAPGVSIQRWVFLGLCAIFLFETLLVIR
jgi:hypothetical protein